MIEIYLQNSLEESLAIGFFIESFTTLPHQSSIPSKIVKSH